MHIVGPRTYLFSGWMGEVSWLYEGGSVVQGGTQRLMRSLTHFRWFLHWSDFASSWSVSETWLSSCSASPGARVGGGYVSFIWVLG